VFLEDLAEWLIHSSCGLDNLRDLYDLVMVNDEDLGHRQWIKEIGSDCECDSPTERFRVGCHLADRLDVCLRLSIDGRAVRITKQILADETCVTIHAIMECGAADETQAMRREMRQRWGSERQSRRR
jgi:hypothetical protein